MHFVYSTLRLGLSGMACGLFMSVVPRAIRAYKNRESKRSTRIRDRRVRSFFTFSG